MNLHATLPNKFKTISKFSLAPSLRSRLSPVNDPHSKANRILRQLQTRIDDKELLTQNQIAATASINEQRSITQDLSEFYQRLLNEVTSMMKEEKTAGVEIAHAVTRLHQGIQDNFQKERTMLLR
jgi:outer membrane murein-binding lipoprotein Lpp